MTWRPRRLRIQPGREDGQGNECGTQSAHDYPHWERPARVAASHAVSQPPRVNINEILIRPTDQER